MTQYGIPNHDIHCSMCGKHGMCGCSKENPVDHYSYLCSSCANQVRNIELAEATAQKLEGIGLELTTINARLSRLEQPGLMRANWNRVSIEEQITKVIQDAMARGEPTVTIPVSWLLSENPK